MLMLVNMTEFLQAIPVGVILAGYGCYGTKELSPIDTSSLPLSATVNAVFILGNTAMEKVVHTYDKHKATITKLIQLFIVHTSLLLHTS